MLKIKDIFLKYETHSAAHVTFCTFKSVNSGNLYIIYFKTQNIHCIYCTFKYIARSLE